jgi:outer membrane protein OmpA-like peptidoglycan-associated protein
MTERALVSGQGAAGAAGLDDVQHDNPATRLLDALRAGDGDALAAAVGQSTTVTAENMPWGCRGPDEVQTMLREARERFPGLTYESSTRHVGFGLVVEEARVRDVAGEAEAALAAEVDEAARVAEDEVRAQTHPMWDEPVRGRSTGLVLWNEFGRLDLPLPPVPLNMPVRVTVRHDDLQVHEVVLSFPAALLKRALGQYVDPLEMSLSEVQSAFIAPAGAGLTTVPLDGPPLTLADAPSVAQPPSVGAPTSAAPRRRRRRRLVLLVLLVLAILAGAGWWAVQGRQQTQAAASPPAAASPRVASASKPSQSTTQQVASSTAPTVTRTQSTSAPARTPTVTLKSDLAFGFNSSTLSPEAKAAVATVAKQVRTAGLTGRIYVDGYTDDIGSAAYGLVLSQRRADAVSTYLQSQLLGAPVSIVSAGHGEANPIASNATAAGQQQNRRVTITLPQH